MTSDWGCNSTNREEKKNDTVLIFRISTFHKWSIKASRIAVLLGTISIFMCVNLGTIIDHD